MAVFCDFVSFCNAHEKQQVFMHTVKCVFVCGCVRVVVYVCVGVCVCVCVKERERERERENLHSKFTTQAQKFLAVFFSREKGRGLSLVSSAAS